MSLGLTLKLGLCSRRSRRLYNEDLAFKQYLKPGDRPVKIRNVSCEQVAELLRRVWIEDLLDPYFDDTVDKLVIDENFHCADLEVLMKRLLEIDTE